MNQRRMRVLPRSESPNQRRVRVLPRSESRRGRVRHKTVPTGVGISEWVVVEMSIYF